MEIDLMRNNINQLINESNENADDGKKSETEMEKQAKFRKAIEKCKEAYKKIEELTNHIDKATYDHAEHKIHFNLAILSLLCKDIKSSKQYLDKIRDNFTRKKIDTEKLCEIGYLYIKLAFAHKRLGKNGVDETECFENACEFLTQSSNPKDIEYLCEIYTILAMTFYHKRNMNKAMKYVEEILEYLVALTDSSVKAQIYIDLATIVAKNDFKRAVSFLNEASNIVKKIGSSKSKDMNFKMLEITLNKNFGVIYNRHGKFQLSYQKSIIARDLIKEQINQLNKLSSHRNITEALKALKQHLSDLYFNLAYASLGIGKIDESLQNFDEASKIAQEINVYQNQIECLEAKASIFASNNQTKKSVECFEKAIDLCESARHETDSRMYKDLAERLWRKLRTISLKQTLEESIENHKKTLMTTKQPVRQVSRKYVGDEYDEFDSSLNMSYGKNKGLRSSQAVNSSQKY